VTFRLTRRAVLKGLAAAAPALSLLSPRRALARSSLRAAVLKFGTVNWLLDVIKANKLDSHEDFALEITELASNSATQVALLGGEADLMVSDWFWVMRQRALGGDYQFMPYSAALGSLIVAKDSPIKAVADLKGKRIGVAGGPLDKSWLLLRAYGKKQGVGDLADNASPVFGAPPLLNEQMLAGRIDALLNYWHYAARLEAKGYRRILPVAEMMKAFGIESVLPLVGFVFSGKLAADEPHLIRGFANSMQNAQKLLLTSDAEWDRIRPLMRVSSDEEFKVMRARYREGLLHTWSARDRKAAAKLFDVLADVGGEELVGRGVKFDPKAFWDGLVF
jgi:NitT/TauT family transport system substrate-binding protein